MKFQFPSRNKTIYCLPNRFGLTLFLIFFVIILAGAVYSNNIVFMMGFVVLSLIFAAILQTARTIRDLDVLAVQISSSPAGTSARGRVVLRNLSNHHKRRLIVEIKELGLKTVVHDLRPHEVRSVDLVLRMPEKRGRYYIRRTKLSTDSPYGLFSAWMYFHRKDEYIVYAKPLGHRDIPKWQDSQGEEFSDHRRYVDGDNSARINWKIFAKKNQLLIKVYDDHHKSRLIFSLDSLSNLSLEPSISQLALWLTVVQENKIEYALELPGYNSGIQSGPQHYRQCMVALSLYGL